MIKRNFKGQFIKGEKRPDMSGNNHPLWKGGEKTIICHNCNKEFQVRICRKNKAKFCSHKCYWKWLKGKPAVHPFKKGHPKPKNAYVFPTGEKNNRWSGGRTHDKFRYILISQPNHPFRSNRGYVREHRLVAEKCLGRYLTKKEQIHHINEVKTDNRPENLYLFSTNSKHTKYHSFKNKPILKSNLHHI